MKKPTSVVRVWDPLVRLFHWSLAIGFAVAFLTEDDLLALHVQAGYLILGLLLIRLLWGFAGPRHARWSDFVREPAAIAAYLATPSVSGPAATWGTIRRVGRWWWCSC